MMFMNIVEFCRKMELAAKKARIGKLRRFNRGKAYGDCKTMQPKFALAAMKSVFMPVIRQEYGQHPNSGRKAQIL